MVLLQLPQGVEKNRMSALAPAPQSATDTKGRSGRTSLQEGGGPGRDRCRFRGRVRRRLPGERVQTTRRGGETTTGTETEVDRGNDNIRTGAEAEKRSGGGEVGVGVGRGKGREEGTNAVAAKVTAEAERMPLLERENAGIETGAEAEKPRGGVKAGAGRGKGRKRERGRGREESCEGRMTGGVPGIATARESGGAAAVRICPGLGRGLLAGLLAGGRDWGW